MKRSTVWFLLGLLIIAGAGLLAWRVSPSTSANAAAPSPEKRAPRIELEMLQVVDDGRGPVRVSYQDPPQLPAGPLAAAGILVRRDGDQVYVGGGEIEIDVEVVNDEEPQVAADFNGPIVSITIDDETRIYLDVTPHPSLTEEDVVSGSKLVTREVQLMAEPKEFESATEVRAWGSYQGDQLVAGTIVFRPIR